jgi:alcohol dehydrogenase (NADP+)
MGTWKAAVGEVKEAVKQALRLGYRYVDCSPMYGNQREVGEALREATSKDGQPIPREEVYIVSKVKGEECNPTCLVGGN